jgi:ATP-dependent DNA helicase RecG
MLTDKEILELVRGGKLTNVDEIRDIFQRHERIYFDAVPAPRVRFDEELDRDNLLKFRREAGCSFGVPDEQILDNLQVFGDDGVPLAGGVLFFCRAPERFFFHAVVRCVQFKGTDKVIILDDKTFGGPLVKQYEQAMGWLQSKLTLSYIIEGTGPRREVWEMPLNVFKEAIINALAHRDYYEQGASITIEMFDDRIEITNPGGLLPVVARNFGRKSLSRNPLIFGLFTRMHLVEHIGSGIPRMQKEMLDAGLEEPVFETEGMFTVTFMRPAARVSPEVQQQFEKRPSTPASTTVGRHSSIVSDEPAVYHTRSAVVTPQQQRILDILREHPHYNLEDVAAELGVGRTTVATQTKRLRELGLLLRQGRRYDGIWVVP